jgi:NAD(P) transhydrogenase subunit alpha
MTIKIDMNSIPKSTNRLLGKMSIAVLLCFLFGCGSSGKPVGDGTPPKSGDKATSATDANATGKIDEKAAKPGSVTEGAKAPDATIPNAVPGDAKPEIPNAVPPETTPSIPNAVPAEKGKSNTGALPGNESDKPVSLAVPAPDIEPAGAKDKPKETLPGTASTAAKSSTPTAEPLPETDNSSLLFVFMLATFIGIGVIMRVSRLLHTPLMSLTNAISAIAVVGSIIVTGRSESPPAIRFLGAVALFASMTNIVSGFLITDRMLKMFKSPNGGKPSGGQH